MSVSLNLPEEILVNIVDCSIPSPHERVWDSVEAIPPGVEEFFEGWRQRCQNLRLVCRSFSRLASLRAALFHTVHWRPTKRSIDALHRIASRNDLALLVRKFVAHGPPCGYFDLSALEFRQLEEKEHKNEYQEKLLPADLTIEQRDACVAVLLEKRRCSSLGPSQWMQEWRQYVLDRKEYVQVMKDPNTHKKLVFAFQRFIKTSHFDLLPLSPHSWEAERHDLTFGPSSRPMTLPLVNKMRDSASSELLNMHMFVYNALRTSTAHVSSVGIDCSYVLQLRYLTFIPKIDCKHLKSLRLHRYEAPDHSTFGIDNLFEATSTMNLLEELHLEQAHLEEPLQLGSARHLSKLPKLRTLALYSTYVVGNSLAYTLQELPSISDLRLYDVRLEERDRSPSWHNIFSIVRQKNVRDYEFRDLYNVGEHLCLSDKTSQAIKQELRAYINMEAGWTSVLEFCFPDGDDDSDVDDI